MLKGTGWGGVEWGGGGEGTQRSGMVHVRVCGGVWLQRTQHGADKALPDGGGGGGGAQWGLGNRDTAWGPASYWERTPTWRARVWE